jgi:hypothetical protein
MTFHPKSARTILKARQGGGRVGAADPDPRAVSEVAKHSPDFRGKPRLQSRLSVPGPANTVCITSTRPTALAAAG